MDLPINLQKKYNRNSSQANERMYSICFDDLNTCLRDGLSLTNQLDFQVDFKRLN